MKLCLFKEIGIIQLSWGLSLSAWGQGAKREIEQKELLPGCSIPLSQIKILGSLSNDNGKNYENITYKGTVALLQTLSRLFQLVQLVKH